MDAKENRRLAHLVKIAYRIYRGEVAVPSVPKPARREPVKGFSEEAYRQGLEQEIEESYSSRNGTSEFLKRLVRDGSVEGFTEGDCLAAVQVLDEFLASALCIESRLGDTREAVAALEEEIPGLPGGLYADVIGYLAYVNR
jgi:hypothetical protein